MQITAQMFKAFEDDALRRTAQGILDFVEEEKPGTVEAMPIDVRVPRVLDGMDRAAALGVPRGHPAIALFAVLRFLAAPDFDRHPACQAILNDRDLPPEARVFALLDPALGVPWEEIAAAGDWDRCA
jgi:hypothetical protein